MMTIRLLGVPAILRDGRALRPPRGRKAWALLGYLLLAERPPSRRHLSEMLFRDADDPLGALRWTLAEIRRCVGDAVLLEGDPLTCAVAPDVVVDVHSLTASPADPARLLEIDGVLLAADALERAWHLARQLNDACWEGMAARGLSLLNAKRGNHVDADKWLTEAAARSTRPPDRYQWVHGHVLDTMITSDLDRGTLDRAAALVETLATLAARCDMRELVVRAHLHRYQMGDAAALSSARLLANDIDNPALATLLTQGPRRIGLQPGAN